MQWPWPRCELVIRSSGPSPAADADGDRLHADVRVHGTVDQPLVEQLAGAGLEGADPAHLQEQVLERLDSASRFGCRRHAAAGPCVGTLVEGSHRLADADLVARHGVDGAQHARHGGDHLLRDLVRLDLEQDLTGRDGLALTLEPAGDGGVLHLGRGALQRHIRHRCGEHIPIVR